MSATPANANAGIAVIGMAGRFPKARSVDEFWRNLCNGVEGISFFTDEQLAAAGVEFPKGNSHYVKARGVLENADGFDAAFFGMTPREAEVMDPQHRLFLECAWEALEHAGCDPAKFDGAIGVFAGMSQNTYLTHNLLTRPELVAQLNEHQLMLGNDKDFLATRVSYKLNLRGPSLNIQTACSTSLVAVCVACQNLLHYECDAALAGAVSVLFPQKRGYWFQEGGIASPDGHCRAFDAKAAGTVAGEGVAMVVLKRLEDALADGDTIYAVIKGFATNNDGANKIGYTAPSVEGQAEVVASAQAMAGFAPDTIGYVEAHGTGTPLGDPIEVEGLTKAFRAGTDRKHFCAIGSVKSNVGHLDVAAGVAGLIKAALALHHQKIPPTLHFQTPNPKIDFANSPFFVNARLTEWKHGETPRRAGVSSFGLGGTNAHVVLEAAPAAQTSKSARSRISKSAGARALERPAGLESGDPAGLEACATPQLLVLSARTGTALDQATANLTAHLNEHPELKLADVAYTLQAGRREFPHRRALICRDAAEAVSIWESRDAKHVFTRSTETENPPVVFMFPGQGAQQVNKARELYEREPVFRAQVDSCCEMLQPHLEFDLRTVIFPNPGRRQRDAAHASQSEIRNPKSEIDQTLLTPAATRLRQTAVAQPALFVIEYALAQLWMSWGVRPAAMIGHSIGEYVAACLAGVFTLADALALVVARGRMMQQMPAGKMLAVRLPESEVTSALTENLSLAAVNAPSLCVVSGPAPVMETLQHTWAERGVACAPLPTSHAFHSAMMEPVLRPFAGQVGRLKLNAPKIPFISNVTGAWITAEQATDPDYWAKHLRQTVRFADGVAELCKDPARVFLEAGPGQTLSRLAKQHPASQRFAATNPASGADHAIIPSLRHAKDSAADLEILLAALGQLWLAGVEIDWKNFYRNERCRRVPLPTYPFERKRYFIEPTKTASAQTPAPAAKPAPPDEPPDAVPIRFVSASAPATPRERILESLRTLLRDLSGLSSAALNRGATFAELGFESLFLTQLSVALEKKFGVRVAFRQLLEEFSTLEALAAHLERCGGGNDEDRAAQPPAGENCLSLAPALPLTEAQRELWLASQMSDAASCAYNECRLLHLRGELKENTLTAAMQTLVDRHEALRVTITSNGDFQKIQPALKLDLPLLDWSRLPAEARASRLDALEREEARLPFDLAAGPLLRAWLIRLEEQHHVLVLTVHHLVCDGHSLGILLRELGEIYSAETGKPGMAGAGQDAQQRVPACPPPRWSDYVRRRSRDNPAPIPDEGFWLKQFADEAPVLELPTDRRRSTAWTFEGARESRVLPAALGTQLKRIAAQRGGTMFTTLLAAYGALLHRLSGQGEIVIGIPVADRAVEGGGLLVGHCVNFLPLRLKFEADATFATNLARAQKTFLEAHEHQTFTFGRLLQKLNLPRHADRMPLASVTFNAQRLDEAPKFAGLEAELDANPHAFTHFDLGFDVTDLGGALRVNCRYNTNLFAAETIRRWLGHFQTLLEGIVAQPAQKIGELPLLTDAERNQLFLEWNPAAAKPAGSSNGAALTAGSGATDKCIHQLFEEQVARTPDAVAVTFETRSLTYRELNRRADRLAAQLRTLGVGPEVRVGLCLERSLEMIVGLLAILKAGGAYVPMDPAYPRERIAFMLQDAHVPVLLTQTSLRDRFRFEIPNLKLRCVDDGQSEEKTGTKDQDNPASGFTFQDSIPPSALPPSRSAKARHAGFDGASKWNKDGRVPDADNLAYVIYTSGSTGRPKGVMVTHRNVTRLFTATRPWFEFNAQDVWTLFHSCAFDFSVWEIWGALLHGGRLVIVPYVTSRSPAAFLELLACERVTVLNQTPSAFRQLVQAEQNAGPPPELALRHVIFGGEALEMQSLKPWFERHGDRQPRLVNMYGITETTVHVTYRPLAAADVDSGSVIGTPIPDLEIYILDARRQPVPIGVPGEIYVGGAGVARGYLNRPELTAEKFIPNPFNAGKTRPEPGPNAPQRVQADRLYQTGDLARWLPNGDLEYLGRADHQVKIRGHRIELGEIETALTQHPNVRECAVIAREDLPGDKRLVAYVVAQAARPAGPQTSSSAGPTQFQRPAGLEAGDPTSGQAGALSSKPAAGELRDFLKSKLPDYMVPSAFVLLDKLPLTTNGKLDRRALPAPEPVRPEPDENYVAPRTPTEEALAEIWRQALRRERVGANDNFFELGGHSLLMTQILLRVREAFQLELPMRRFFESPTVAGLAAAVEEMLVEEIDRLSDDEARRLAHSEG